MFRLILTFAALLSVAMTMASSSACSDNPNINVLGRYPGQDDLIFANTSLLAIGFGFTTPANTSEQNYIFYNLRANYTIACANEYGFTQVTELYSPIVFNNVSADLGMLYHGNVENIDIPAGCMATALHFIPESPQLTGSVASNITGTVVEMVLTFALYTRGQRLIHAGNVTSISPGTYALDCV